MADVSFEPIRGGVLMRITAHGQFLTAALNTAEFVAFCTAGSVTAGLGAPSWKG